MAKKRSKKINPRRIPMPKSMIDCNEILEEATREDMYHAWLLVFNAMVEQNRIEIDEIPALADEVKSHVGSASLHDDKLVQAERIMGIPTPYKNLNPDNIKSLVELERFKQKVYKIAIHTSLSVICLGLNSTERFTEDELRQIFFNVDLTLSEIDHGCNSFHEIENALTQTGLLIERVDDDFHYISVQHQSNHAGS